MADQIRVLIVDDIPETRDHLTKLLGFESDIEVVGSAASGARGDRAGRQAPPGRRPDGHQHAGHGRHRRDRAAGRAGPDRRRRDDVRPGRGGLPPPLDARRRARVPRQAVQQRRAHRLDPPGLRPRAREAVADRRRPPPAGAGRRRRPGDGEPGQVVAVFSPKGGVGRTTVAVNLAVAAATELGKKVVLVDGSFQFGDVGVLLNLNPKNKSIADLIPELETGRARVARHVRDQPHRRHPRAARPALARDGRADHAGRVKRVLEALRARARPRGRRLHVVVQRHDARDPRHRPT